MMIDVAAIAAQAIPVIASELIDIEVRSGGSYVNGSWVSTAPVVTNDVSANVQPLRGDELKRLPEGRRNEEAVRIFCETELNPGDKSIGREADRVTWFGRVYEVENVRPWHGAFYDAAAVRVGD